MAEPDHVRTKDKVLQIVASHGVPLHNVDELRDLWGPFAPTPRELTRVLWDLQKQGEIKFNEIKAGRDSLLTKIRLSRGIQLTAFRSNDSKGRHPVGVDMTNPSNHSWRAEGGPIERIKPAAVQVTQETPMATPRPKLDWTEYVTKINPNRVRPILPVIARGVDRPAHVGKELEYSSARITGLTTRAEQLGWVTKEVLARPDRGIRLILTDEGARLAAEPFIDERSRPYPAHRKSRITNGRAMEAHTEATETPTEYPQLDTPVGYTDAEARADFKRDELKAAQGLFIPKIIDVMDLDKYPLISELMTKEDRITAYESAAKLLEGFDADLALSLLEKIQITPLEAEVIALVRSMR